MTLEKPFFGLVRKITEFEYFLIRVRLSDCNKLEFIRQSV